jgi:hypothetical protein
VTKKTSAYRLDAVATMLEDLKEWKKELVLPGFLRRLPTRFDRKNYYREDLSYDASSLSVVSSGYASACAVGFAALHPFFNEMGLIMHPNGLPTYKNCVGSGFVGDSYDVLSKFFGIPEHHVMKLFGAVGPNNPKRIAAVIREYVRENLL